MKKRLDLLDATKGICIILMTISHFPRIAPHSFVYHLNHTVFMAFKMPLFFMISGYLSSVKRGFTHFIVSKADALLKTTLNVMLLFCLLLFIKNLDGTIFLHMFLSLRNGSVFPTEVALYPLWFPIALFLSLLIVRGIMVANKKMSKIHAKVLTIITYLLLLAFYRLQISFYFLNTLIFRSASSISAPT